MQSTDRRACFGVGCHQHSRCARYHAVDGPTDPLTRATCRRGDGSGAAFPLFVPLVPVIDYATAERALMARLGA